MAQLGKCLVSYSFNASKVSHYGAWVVESGAIDHMTHSPTRFNSYKPCPNTKKITIVDGSSITIPIQGIINLTRTFLLKNVLHVPKLSTTLISIPQITKDLNCKTTFSSTHCVFQDLVMRRTIRLAKGRNGLYYLKEMIDRTNKESKLSLSCSNFSSNNS